VIEGIQVALKVFHDIKCTQSDIRTYVKVRGLIG